MAALPQQRDVSTIVDDVLRDAAWRHLSSESASTTRDSISDDIFLPLGGEARFAVGDTGEGWSPSAAANPEILRRTLSSRYGELSKVAEATFGDTEKAWQGLSSLGVEFLYEAMTYGGGLFRRSDTAGRRALVVPSSSDSPATLLLLDPKIVDVGDSRRLQVEIEPRQLRRVWELVRASSAAITEPKVAKVAQFGPAVVRTILDATQPQVVVSRMPRMIPVCAPSPAIEIETGSQRSSAGILCVDAQGVLGVTGCFHGTGPVGTSVTVGLRRSSVTLADPVQDIVFIPLGEGFNLPEVRGLRRVLSARTPSHSARASFDGVTSGRTFTRISSHDAGLLRRRRTIQLKVQTPADTNSGDSGSALIDEDDHVIGFAFERSDYDDFPEITDWIWAANALAALGLTPI